MKDQEGCENLRLDQCFSWTAAETFARRHYAKINFISEMDWHYQAFIIQITRMLIGRVSDPLFPDASPPRFAVEVWMLAWPVVVVFATSPICQSHP